MKRSTRPRKCWWHPETIGYLEIYPQTDTRPSLDLFSRQPKDGQFWSGLNNRKRLMMVEVEKKRSVAKKQRATDSSYTKEDISKPCKPIFNTMKR